MVDDLESLRQELEEARAEAGRLAEQLADREARAAELEETAGGLRRELEGAHTARREAVTRYRDAVLAQSPDLPAELVTGDTIAAVDGAAQQAREIVARVREHVTATDAARPVPAGSPLRRPPDLAAMSAAEKIRYGLGSRE